MKGITCSEAKDILEKLNRLERLRQGIKSEPEKGINPFADEFKDFGEQILPEKKGIIAWIDRVIMGKYAFITFFACINFMHCLDKGWSDLPLLILCDLFVYAFFAFWIWIGCKIDPLTEKEARTINTLAIMEELRENNGKLPKGMTKEEALGAINDMAISRYKHLKKKGRI